MRVGLLSLVTIASACAHLKPLPKVALTPPRELCDDPRLADGEFCLPAERMEALLGYARFRVLHAGLPGRGIGGAVALAVEFPDEKLRVRAKWKPAGRGGDGFNRSPRHELAAYELQKMFLTSDEWVVPPTVMRCLPLDTHRASIDAKTGATFEGTDCVLGLLSYWLEGVRTLELDRGRYARDLGYRATIANLNMLTYLIDHHDTRASNFLITEDRARPRAFAIDNGLAFSGIRNPVQMFVEDWSELRVPSVPSDTADRLWRVTRADLEKLRVVAQFEIRDEQLEPVAPSEPFDENHGVRRRGNLIQLGLTRAEVDHVHSRLQELLLKLARGKLAVFDSTRNRARAGRHRRGGRL